MKSIRKRTNELLKTSVNLKYLSGIEKMTYEQQKEVQKQQDEVYKKWKFFKNMNSLLEK